MSGAVHAPQAAGTRRAMSDEDRGQPDAGEYASPPCYLHEFEPGYGAQTVRHDTWSDVARWRKAERKRLLRRATRAGRRGPAGPVEAYRCKPRPGCRQGQRTHRQRLLAVPGRAGPAQLVDTGDRTRRAHRAARGHPQRLAARVSRMVAGRSAGTRHLEYPCPLARPVGTAGRGDRAGGRLRRGELSASAMAAASSTGRWRRCRSAPSSSASAYAASRICTIYPQPHDIADGCDRHRRMKSMARPGSPCDDNGLRMPSNAGTGARQ